MPAKSETSVIIASDLRTGCSVYRSADSSWVDSIDEAQLLDSVSAEKQLESALGDERDNLVIDPYLVAVDAKSVALEIRERIRASGPSIFTVQQKSQTEAA